MNLWRTRLKRCGKFFHYPFERTERPVFLLFRKQVSENTHFNVYIYIYLLFCKQVSENTTRFNIYVRRTKTLRSVESLDLSVVQLSQV